MLSQELHTGVLRSEELTLPGDLKTFVVGRGRGKVQATKRAGEVEESCVGCPDHFLRYPVTSESTCPSIQVVGNSWVDSGQDRRGHTPPE